ncbi:alpha/beta hydrolase-fold protein [Thalassotalea sp. G2M2-11]|uniref:alpha/beta hydrolase n=1 Tax=Thalassotalea sp. G2M2-11 TaxID=2787627 RepID=UPI0019D12D7E|nr:alpha/beta hydrolase-fold protein [Thalassotalea sp. G2M2-11]
MILEIDKVLKCLIGLVLMMSMCSLHAQNQLEISTKADFSIGEIIEFDSVVLNEKRQLNIYLPRSYHGDSKQKYPVIYLLDGGANEDFIHLAGLVQFGSLSWINQLPETIIVGIVNVDRKRDFTYPTNNQQDQQDFPSSGRSEQFIEFIGSELQPLIEKNYRTHSVRTLIGQSLGGLLATEVLFKSPNLFDNYIIISPSLWWDDESLFSYTPLTSSKEKSIYIGVGKEGAIMERLAKTLFEKVNTKKPANYSVNFQFFEQLNHGDTLHLAVYDAFERIFRIQKK